ncbi:ComF family protein [Eubacteriales bacterium OttesenSCG-928-M02]|nr:ComF family protein [Eubacteriales bacterium OttesenSCG-928-M02]
MKGFLSAVQNLLYPLDVSCSLCSQEKGMGNGIGLCSACIATLPMDIHRETVQGVDARWAMAYEGDARTMVTGLKFENKRYFVPPLAHFMAQAFSAHPVAADLILPVPLHKKKLRQRGFNQSALLARALSELLGIPTKEDGLSRIRDTLPQMDLSREARLQNVVNAFAANGDYAGMHILIVDDILTTGASLMDAQRALFLAGATASALCATRA